jgi:hypothetical protein
MRKAGTYIRTKEIRDKQSKSLILFNKTYDNRGRVRKSIETKIKNGTLRKGGNRKPRPKLRIIKFCVICGSKFETIKSKKDRRVCSRICLYKDDHYIDQLRGRDMSHLHEWLYQIKQPNLPSYKRYANKVRRLSEKVYQENIDIINPCGHMRSICGVENGYQLDHIKSIKKCYNEGLSEEEASSLNNLRLIPWKDNLNKRTYEKYVECEKTKI